MSLLGTEGFHEPLQLGLITWAANHKCQVVAFVVKFPTQAIQGAKFRWAIVARIACKSMKDAEENEAI